MTRFLLIYLLIRGSNFELNFDNWSKLLSSLLPRKAILVHLKTVYFQKQPSRDVPTKKDVLKIPSKFTEEHPCQSVISIKLQSNFGSSGGLFLYFEMVRNICQFFSDQVLFVISSTSWFPVFNFDWSLKSVWQSEGWCFMKSSSYFLHLWYSRLRKASSALRQINLSSLFWACIQVQHNTEFKLKL